MNFDKRIAVSARITYRTTSGYYYTGVITSDVAVRMYAEQGILAARPLNDMIRQAQQAHKGPALLPAHSQKETILVNTSDRVEFAGVSELVFEETRL